MRHFEDLVVYRRARELIRDVYTITSTGALARDFRLVSQMRDAAVSIASNIAEGCGRGTDPDFRNFLRYARGSASEVQAQLAIARDVHAAASGELYERAQRLGWMLAALIARLR